jgi:hypothetical protein
MSVSYLYASNHLPSQSKWQYSGFTNKYLPLLNAILIVRRPVYEIPEANTQMRINYPES